MFDYYDKDTTREQRLAYLDGVALVRCNIKPQFAHNTGLLSEAFSAGKADA